MANTTATAPTLLYDVLTPSVDSMVGWSLEGSTGSRGFEGVRDLETEFHDL